jgi:hypothetical protein
MFTRPMLFVGVLIASVVVPYVSLNEQLANTAQTQWNRLFGATKPDEDQQRGGTPGMGHTGFERGSSPAPSATIEQAFRFDVTPQWVASRWPRVSTVLGDAEQLGMRVAWVSGTRSDDLAGSLTYYFDAHHQLQRLTCTGLTGDPRRTLATVVPAFGLKSQPTTDAAHYTAGNPRAPTSEIIVRHLPVLTTEPGGARAEVSIDLRRADAHAATGHAERDPEFKLLPSTYRRW